MEARRSSRLARVTRSTVTVRPTSAAGGTAPAVLNAANEEAVSAFLQGRIGFLDIPALVGEALAALAAAPAGSLEALLAADTDARRLTRHLIDRPHGTTPA